MGAVSFIHSDMAISIWRDLKEITSSSLCFINYRNEKFADAAAWAGVIDIFKKKPLRYVLSYGNINYIKYNGFLHTMK